MHKIAFLLLPDFSHLGVAAAIEPLFVANWLAQRTLFEWRVVSADGAPVRASNGMSVDVDGDLAAAAQAKTVFVLASFDAQAAACDPRVLRWLRRAANGGVEIGGIENGSQVLAASGLLNGRRAAVHWDNLQGFQERYPKVQAAAQLYCRSGGRITCAGAAAILDLMAAWIGWHGEPELASEVADHLLQGRMRAADEDQRPLPGPAAHSGDPAVQAARALMLAHVEEPLDCGAIARHLCLSLRQLERRFRRELHCSVLQHYRQIRMAKAHQLLQQTDLSVIEVAISCGFASPEYFGRLYRGQFGCPPSRDRRQSTTAPVLRRLPARRGA